MWHKYPRQMLRARVISEGIRAVYPGGCSGFYTPEEVADFDQKPVIEQKQPLETSSQKTEPTHVEAEIVENSPNKPVQDEATKLVPASEPVKMVSSKSWSKFEMAKKVLGKKEFDSILLKAGFKMVNDVPNENIAQTLLREMRIAFESKETKK